MTMPEAPQLLRPTSQTALHDLGCRVQGHKMRVLGCQKAVHVSLGLGITSPSPTLSNSPNNSRQWSSESVPGHGCVEAAFLVAVLTLGAPAFFFVGMHTNVMSFVAEALVIGVFVVPGTLPRRCFAGFLVWGAMGPWSPEQVLMVILSPESHAAFQHPSSPQMLGWSWVVKSRAGSSKILVRPTLGPLAPLLNTQAQAWNYS